MPGQIPTVSPIRAIADNRMPDGGKLATDLMRHPRVDRNPQKRCSRIRRPVARNRLIESFRKKSGIAPAGSGAVDHAHAPAKGTGMRKISRYTTRLRHRSTNARQIDFSCRMSGKLLANGAVNRIGKGRQYESGGSGVQPMEQTRHLRIVADIPDGRKPCEQRRRQRSRFPDGNGMASLPGRFVDGTQIRIRINDLERQIRFRLHRTIRPFWNPLGANNRPKLRNIGFVGTSPILENQPVRKSIRQQSPGRSGKPSQNNFVKPLASHVLRRDGKLHCLHAQEPTIPPNTAPQPHRPRWLTAPRRLCGAIHGVTLPPPPLPVAARHRRKREIPDWLNQTEKRIMISKKRYPFIAYPIRYPTIAMTREEAEKEFWELSRRCYMWEDFNSSKITPYQHAVLRRQSALFGYIFNDKPAPVDNWVAPPCDVEETVENWYRNHFPKTWHERMLANGGKLPPQPF